MISDFDEDPNTLIPYFKIRTGIEFIDRIVICEILLKNVASIEDIDRR